MHWLYTVLMGFIFFAGVAMMIREGLWSNLLTMFNVLFAGLIAFTAYGPVAIWLDELLDGEYTYMIDFLALWALFAISMLVLRLCTDSLSRTRVRFKLPIESFGGPIVAVGTAWLLVGIAGAIFHAAPLPKGFLNNAIVVEKEADVEMSPFRSHLQWLRFVGNSIMLLGDSEHVDALKSRLDNTATQEGYNALTANCDAYADLWARIFIIKYQLRRSQLEANADGLRVNRG